jgi:hypothetical protein
VEEERREQDVVDEGVGRVDEPLVEEPVAAQDDADRHHEENRDDRLQDVQTRLRDSPFGCVASERGLRSWLAVR